MKRPGPAPLLPVGFGLLGLLSGCGHAPPPPTTMSVTCDGSLMLAGVSSIAVTSRSGGLGTTLGFPDPVNPGQTGSLPIVPGHACTIVRDSAKPDTADGHPGRTPAES